MGLFSSIFGTSKKSQPNTALQEAEARRQAELEAQRYRDLLAQQQQIADQQRTDTERRYQEQLQAQQAENQRQRDAAQTLLDRQIQAQRDEADRQEARQNSLEAQRQAERDAVLRAQEEKAQRSREYATGRQKLMDEGKAAIEGEYARFDDDFYGQFEQAFVDQFKPEVERGYEGARKDTTYAFGDAGNLRSSAAAKGFGDLKQQLTKNLGKVAGGATDAATSFRNDLEGQKSDALQTVFSAGGVGSENLPDGVTDVGGQLESLGSQIGALTTTARNRAKAIKTPSFQGANLNLDFGVKTPRLSA